MYAIVLSNGDLRRLRPSTIHRLTPSIARLEVTVKMGNGVKQGVRMALPVF
jgi:hypothetical protein